jgi:hypothetical protein
MKTNLIISLIAGLTLGAGFTLPSFAAPAPAPDNVTVTYQDPDSFSDVLENHTNTPSTYYLGQLKECIEQTATRRLAVGEKLIVTVTDIDLAGETRFNQPNEIRVMKDIYAPRVRLKFQLLGADGKVVKAGDRSLIDHDYLMQARRPGSSEPLFYDKQLLKEWINKEFKAAS